MNSYQQLARERLARRFSRGDGVVVLNGPHQDRRGWVLACGGRSGRHIEVDRPYEVVFLSETGEVAGIATLVSSQLVSDPAGNTGKYGGPARGGAAGGWCGGNSYRRRR